MSLAGVVPEMIGKREECWRWIGDELGGLKDVEKILDRHYLARDPAMARFVIRKLEGRTPMTPEED